MKIILLEDVKGVGKANTIQNVKDGYAVNYLIPHKLAVYYNVTNEEHLHEKLDQLAKEEAERREKAMQLKDKIDSLTLTFSLKTNHGLTFGSISQKQIMDELRKNDIQIEHTALSKFIKLIIGEYDIPVKLYKNIVANLKVNVVEKE